jgi:hypothetical protein
MTPPPSPLLILSFFLLHLNLHPRSLNNTTMNNHNNSNSSNNDNKNRYKQKQLAAATTTSTTATIVAAEVAIQGVSCSFRHMSAAVYLHNRRCDIR